MSRWTSITEAFIRGGKNTAILDSAQDLASSRAEADPLPAIITTAVARIRAAVSAGNPLDADATKIPNSLAGLARGIIVRELKNYLEIDLSDAERKQADDDRSFLNRITDALLRFEAPDDAAGTGEMNASQPTIATVEPSAARRATREQMNGL